jgi:hypothetical protein
MNGEGSRKGRLIHPECFLLCYASSLLAFSLLTTPG